MKITSEINETKLKVQQSYPWFGKYGTSDSYFIILFNRAGCGTVVYSHNYVFSVGHYYEGWSTEAYEPFYGEIKLTSRL